MDTLYGYLKAIHIIFVVCWMAGLFYIVRLFIYHTEAQEKAEPERGILSRQFEVMEKRLWNIITVPSMFLTLAASIALVIKFPAWLQMPWLNIKLVFVLGLVVYHYICQHKIKQMQQGVFKWTSNQLRLWNELATILLFAIVFLAVLKTALDWVFGVVGLVALSVLLMLGVKIYKHYRNKG